MARKQNWDEILKNVSEEEKPIVRQFIESLIDLTEGTGDTCPKCNQTITEMEQVGRSVYGHPCGHRLYQGWIPDNWRKMNQ